MPGKDAKAPQPRDRKWLRRLSVGVVVATIIGSAVAVRSMWGPPRAGAEGAAAKGGGKGAAKSPAPPVEPPRMQVMANVNGQQITRADLARECLLHHGKETLESLVNKHLVSEHCRQRNITVTTKEVEAEIERMAESFSRTTPQWLKMLQEERGISAAQYAKDIIWPTVALRKLADARLQVTPQDLQQAYEMQFGAAVQVSIIVVSSLEKAREVRAKAVDQPKEFGNLAMKYSEDSGSASIKGRIPAIRRHMGDKALEDVAFFLKPGQISDIVQIGGERGQYVIMMCEGHIPPGRVAMADVEKLLTDAIREKKLKSAAKDIFDELQKTCVVENIYNDPKKRAQQPGVAATINGHPISMDDLAEECIDRHGKEVLSGLINHRLVEQACARRKIAIGPQDYNHEIALAAILANKVTADGKPDVQAWKQVVTVEQEMPWEVYLHEVIWPSVALKKLAGEKVQVSEEDLQKGYESNYGPRVRCRAIVLNQQRRAQEVWDAARKIPAIEKLAQRPAARGAGLAADPTPQEQALIEDAAKQFGKLAAQHSIETGSSVLEGEVPPIQRHGGQPKLEQEAFGLRAGDLSSIVQVGDRFVLLFCEGRTRPAATTFAEVRNLIYEDVHEKRLRLAMAEEFDKIKDAAQIDNFLAGTTQASREERELMKRMAEKDGGGDPLAPKSARPGAGGVRQAGAQMPIAPGPAGGNPRTPPAATRPMPPTQR